MMKTLLSVLLILTCFSVFSQTEENDKLAFQNYKEGKKLYEEGKYADAADKLFAATSLVSTSNLFMEQMCIDACTKAAEEAYNNKHYTECGTYLNHAENTLGTSNKKIKYLKVKAYYDAEEYSNAKNELNNYFELAKGNTDAKDEKHLEMLKMAPLINQKKAEQEAEAKELYLSQLSGIIDNLVPNIFPIINTPLEMVFKGQSSKITRPYFSKYDHAISYINVYTPASWFSRYDGRVVRNADHTDQWKFEDFKDLYMYITVDGLKLIKNGKYNGDNKDKCKGYTMFGRTFYGTEFASTVVVGNDRIGSMVYITFERTLGVVDDINKTLGVNYKLEELVPGIYFGNGVKYLIHLSQYTDYSLLKISNISVLENALSNISKD